MQLVDVRLQFAYISTCCSTTATAVWSAIELQLGEFKTADKGQMELYRRGLTKMNNYQATRGRWTILCTGKNREQIELVELDKSGVHVAEQLTGLDLNRKLLSSKTSMSSACIEKPYRRCCWCAMHR